MGVSPGTGAGIGIACALVLLFIAGPVAYRHRKKKRLSQQDQKPVDVEGSGKPQLEGTAVSPSIWRSSDGSAFGQRTLEMSTHRTNRGLGIMRPVPRRPVSEAGGSEVAQMEGSQVAEADASGQRERAELGAKAQSPNRAELRADVSTPPHTSPSSAMYEQQSLPIAEQPERTASLSDTGLPDISKLPGPLLPPPRR